MQIYGYLLNTDFVGMDKVYVILEVYNPDLDEVQTNKCDMVVLRDKSRAGERVPKLLSWPRLEDFLDARLTNVKPRYCQSNWWSLLLEEPRQSSAVRMSICMSTCVPAFLSLPCRSWRILLFIEIGKQRQEARVEEKRREVTGQRIEEHEAFWERSHRSPGESEEHNIPEIQRRRQL